ncbi:SRPBCC family protein [Nonomuraea sp. bgisy101]|uniref:SRPBCC family protein n=1 Tax=Nonomuraea sp. bgisy101 TaxID=3413784 RepID=UPI003D702D6B
MNVDETAVVAAPIERVWRAFTDHADRAEWWDYLFMEPVVGGSLEERWTGEHGEPVVTRGLVTRAAAPEILAFSWSDDGQAASTDVEIVLTARGADTEVRIRETGWNRLPDGAAMAADHRAGWRVHLANLRRHVES